MQHKHKICVVAGPIAEVIAGCILCRCKHLLMIICHVVSPSFTKTE